MKKLILASNNAKKLKELKAILSDMDVYILSQREAGQNSYPASAACCPTERRYAPRANAADRYSQSLTARAASAMIRSSCPTDIPIVWPCSAAR